MKGKCAPILPSGGWEDAAAPPDMLPGVHSAHHQASSWLDHAFIDLKGSWRLETHIQNAEDVDQSTAQCVEAVFETAERVHDRAPGLYAPRGVSRHTPVSHLAQKCCFLRFVASRGVAGHSRRRGPPICRSQAAAHGGWCWARLRSGCAPRPGGQRSSGTFAHASGAAPEGLARESKRAVGPQRA
jgi:hypothetical protein